MKLNDYEDTLLIEYLTEYSYDSTGRDDVNFVHKFYKVINEELIYIQRTPNMSLLFLFRSLVAV